MAKKRPSETTARTVTPERAWRLHRLVRLLGAGSQTRSALAKRLRLDTRGFYRDLEFLRSSGLRIDVEGQRYSLEDPVKQALGKLPFPDPGLTLSEAMQLAKGRSPAHRKIKAIIERITR
jgi:hypothetical protein